MGGSEVPWSPRGVSTRVTESSWVTLGSPVGDLQPSSERIVGCSEQGRLKENHVRYPGGKGRKTCEIQKDSETTEKNCRHVLKKTFWEGQKKTGLGEGGVGVGCHCVEQSLFEVVHRGPYYSRGGLESGRFRIGPRGLRLSLLLVWGLRGRGVVRVLRVEYTGTVHHDLRAFHRGLCT